MTEKTVYRDQPGRRPGDQIRYRNDTLRLEPCRAEQKYKIDLKGESPSDRKTRITLGLRSPWVDHKKLEEKVFNLLMSSGEILTNLTPDR
jgi:hypothetical protein